jgi:DNA mismatch repair ATPase MutS
LKDLGKIRNRHEVVGYLKDNREVLKTIQQQVKKISDLERLISKIATGKVSPREVVYLKESLDAIIPIKELALKSEQPAVKSIGENLHDCELLREKIKTTLNQEAPVAIARGTRLPKACMPNSTICAQSRLRKGVSRRYRNARVAKYGHIFTQDFIQQCIWILYRSKEYA